MSTATAAGPAEQVEIKSVKELVGNIARLLPDDATWDDVQDHIGVCQAIRAGLESIRQGRVVSGADARRLFGLSDRPSPVPVPALRRPPANLSFTVSDPSTPAPGTPR